MTTVKSEWREHLNARSIFNGAPFRTSVRLNVDRQPSHRVTGSINCAISRGTSLSLLKWLMITIVPPGRQTRCAARIIAAASGTTLTTWKAVT
jgi:hypothetical protein